MKRSIIISTSKLAVILSVFLLLLTALPTLALEDRPCAEDMAKFCSGITPGGGRLVKCYQENRMKMSPQCVAWADYLIKNAQDLRDACSKEIDSKCSSEKGDPLEMLDCLQSNYIDLSPKCVKKLNEFKYSYPMPVK